MGPLGAAGQARVRVELRTASARATAELGARLGRALGPGDVVALVGDLGAGKTQLVRGLCRGAAVPREQVCSPSFAIVATYTGRLPVHHADLYRIGSEDELTATGFFDLLGGPGAVVVEWADRIPGALPAERLEITLAHDPRHPDVRHLLAVGAGPRHAALARLLPPRKRRAPGSPERKRPPRVRRPSPGHRQGR